MYTVKATLAALTFLPGPVAMAIEQPEFKLLLETSDYEVRKYEPYLVAEVDIRGEFDKAGDTAFRILAAYIFGENVPGKRMQMTAPVESRSAESGIRMAMTAPVISSDIEGAADTYTYGFVMERQYTMETLPEPKDPRIELRRQSARIMAVRKYSGRWTEDKYWKNESILLSALAADGIASRGEPIFARYNSPFTPSFLRRNEVMVEIAWPGQLSAARGSMELRHRPDAQQRPRLQR